MEKSDIEVYTKTGSTVSSIFNVMNAILGAGIVGLPYALSNLGYINFILGLVLVTIFTLFGLNLLFELCDLEGTTSYEILAEKAFGKVGKFYTSFIIYLHTMFCMCGFMIMVFLEGPAVVEGLVSQTSPEKAVKDTPQ